MAEQSKHPILVVDDEPEILQSLRGLLRMEFEVHTAQNGFEALELLQRQPMHVVMSDQRMLEMTGMQLLSQVQSECPEAIRIVCTGYADIKAVIDAINQGHIQTRCLPDPVSKGNVACTCRQVTCGRRRCWGRAWSRTI